MLKTHQTGGKLHRRFAGVMATLAATSLALTGLVAAGIGAWADPLDGVTGIIPNPDNPSGVTSKIYPGHGASNPKGTICGFVFVEKGDYNTRSGWYKNNSGGFFNPAFGDEALKGVVVHGMVTTKDGEVIPRQHGTKVEPLTAVTDDQGRYCFDFRPYGMEELKRGLQLFDFVKVWPEHLPAYDAYPQGLVPHYFNGGGRTTQILTETLSYLAPAAVTSDARAGVGTKNPYTGGANTAGGYIDGLNFSYKPPASLDGTSSSGEKAKHLPESQWTKPYGTKEQHQHLINMGATPEQIKNGEVGDLSNDWFFKAGDKPYRDVGDDGWHPLVCGYTFIDSSIIYNLYARDGSESILPNVRILASIANTDFKGNITGVRSTQVTTSDEHGRYCFVWESFEDVGSKKISGLIETQTPKILITAYPENLESFNYIPTVNPSANTWLDLYGVDFPAMNEVFHPGGWRDPVNITAESKPYYEAQTMWGQVEPIFGRPSTFIVAPWWLGFAPSAIHADYSTNYGYKKQTITVEASPAIADQAPYAVYWAKEGTAIDDLSTTGIKLVDVPENNAGSASASFKVPSDAQPGRYTLYFVSLDDDGNVESGGIHDMDTFVVVKERGVYFDEASKRDSIRKYDLWNEDKAQIQDIDDEGNPMVNKRGKPIMVDNPYLLTKDPATSKQVIEGYAGDPTYAFFRGIEEKDHKGVVSGDEHNTYTLRMVPTGTTANPEIIKKDIAGIIEENSGEKLTLRADVDFNIPAVDPGNYEIQLISASGEIVDRHAYKVKEGPKVEVAAPKSAKQGATSPQITVKDKRDGHDYKLQFVDAAGKVSEIADGATSFIVPKEAALGNGSVQLVDVTEPGKPAVVAKDTLTVTDGIPPVIHADNVAKYPGVRVAIPVTVTDNVDANIIPTCTSSETWLTWNATAKQMEGTIPAAQPAGDVTITCNAKDAAGNEAEQKTVTLTVKDKPTTPVLSVDKNSAQQGDTVNAAVIAPKADKTYKVQLVDPAGNAVGTPVAVTEAGVDLKIPEKGADGQYTVKLFEEGTAKEIDREVVTVADKSAPVITAPEKITVSVGAPVTDGNEITAEDAVEGSVTPVVQIGPAGSGLTYDPATGKLKGKGGKPGDYIITVTAKDSKGNTTVKQIPLTVKPDNDNPTIDDVLGLSEGKIVGKTSQPIKKVTIKASDDSGVVTLSVKKGTTLPKGLTFDPETGVISGVPREVGTGSFTIVATDPSGNKAEQEIPYVITDGTKPTVKDPGSLEGFVGEKVTLPIEAKDESGAVSCQATGLPKGLTIDPATCTISGTPTEDGGGNIVVTVTDEAGNTTSTTVPYHIIDKKKDTDGDGVPDYLDKCPDTPKDVKVDKDGCPIDNGGTSDKDTDGDGLSDEYEDTKCYDPTVVDGTGQIECPTDPKDQHHTDKNNPDSDGDGVPDGQEIEDGTNPLNPDSFKDTDGDGVPDYIDKCPNTPKDVKVDKNGCPIDDVKDSDGDGVPDDKDKCPDTPKGEPVDENGCADSQKDSDGDGVTDDKDKCPDTPEGAEVDANGCADSQKDDDGDGVTNDKDKCPDTPKDEPVDENGCADSQKDADGDGLSDKDEDTKCYDPSVVDGTGEIECPSDPDDQHKTDKNNPDSDGDGVPDGQEIKDGTNPLNPDSFKDSDGDGVPDYVENKDGTNPNDPNDYKDSDGDGVPDYVENKDGTNPNDPNSFKDTDGDEVPDYIEVHKDKTNPEDAKDYKDSDGDGVPDYVENKDGTNPKDPDSFKDSDKDGLPDYTERHTCYDKNAPGAVEVPCTNEDGTPNPNAAKTNPNNPDTDGDGVPDGQEVANNTNPVNPSFPADVKRPDKPQLNPSNGQVIDGKGQPGGKIEIWVDDKLIGEGTIGDDGNFSVVLKKPLAPGTHFKAFVVDPETGLRSEPAEGVVKVAEAPVGAGVQGPVGTLSKTGATAGALSAVALLALLVGFGVLTARRREHEEI